MDSDWNLYLFLEPSVQEFKQMSINMQVVILTKQDKGPELMLREWKRICFFTTAGV